MNRNMEYIYAVYTAGSFTEAAKDLYISQPCLSAAVKKVEEQLGVPIFNRTTKPLTLTEYGRQYIDYLEKLQRLELEFERYLNDVRGLRTGYLSIGANNVFASFVLPGLIRSFKSQYPGVQVNMVEGKIAYLEDALMRGKVDLVLDNCLLDTGVFAQTCIGTEHLLLAAHKTVKFTDACLTHSDILAGKPTREDVPALPIEAFADLPLIALHTGNDTRFRMDSVFQQAQIPPNIQLEVDQLATAYQIACTGLNATLVSDTLLYKTPANPDMCYYKLDSNITTRPIYMYHKRAEHIPMAMQTFMDMVVTTFGEKT